MKLFGQTPKPYPSYTADTSSLTHAFPTSLKNDVQRLLQLSENMKIWSESLKVRAGDEELEIPHRILADVFNISDLSAVQQTLYHCLYSRSTDGYVREASVRTLLKMPVTDWTTPYLFIALSDYVIQVANVVANEEKLWGPLAKFAQENPELYRLTTARAISFWDLNRYGGIRYEDYRKYPPCKMLKSLR